MRAGQEMDYPFKLPKMMVKDELMFNPDRFHAPVNMVI